MEKVRRYIVFLLGLFINSMGVGLITKANLGTSPISAIPYVLSLRFSLSLGEFTILFSLLLDCGPAVDFKKSVQTRTVGF